MGVLVIGGVANGLQIFHEFVCVGSGFALARRVPGVLLSRSAAFGGAFVFKRGPRRKKECMSLFSRKEDQHNEDRLLANAWSKDYMGRREKVASRQLVRRESAHDADKTVAKAKWPKSGALLNDPHPKAGSAVTRRRLPLNSWPIGSVAIIGAARRVG